MQIKLTRSFASNGKVDEYDVRQMKKALNRLGYYQPPKDSGITEIPDAAVFAGLKAFQKDYKLPVTGTAKPDDETTRALNREAEFPPNGKYIWRTAGDAKVRPAHAQFNGQVRDWSDAPDPGEDYNCRCWSEPVKSTKDIYDPPLKAVYPELLLLPLFRIGWLYRLWKEWAKNSDTDWTLGSHKSEIRWGNQLRNREWTPQQITETIKNGVKYPAPNNVNNGNRAIRYEYEGRFVVRDEVTKEILQLISGKNNFKPNILE